MTDIHLHLGVLSCRPMPVSHTYQPSPVILNVNLKLSERLADPVRPAEFPKHLLRFRNQIWAERIGLGELSSQEWEDHFARFQALPDNLTEPLALRYHGHQFRSYNPDLGDGRGFLFAQLKDCKDARILDLGTKGSGQTPYSRGGDGRLTLKGAVREALATEMLESLGVDTSKTFSIFETGEELERHDEPSPTRSAVLVRLSHSHIRFGTFQRLDYFKETEMIGKLIGYCVRHYFPELETLSASEQPLSFFREVVKRSADLTASWMIAGFVHGVLNTDNMNITGESFDYGPYRFLPHYDPEFTAAYFDNTGLYAYGRQADAVLWNLQALAQSLTSVVESESLVNELQEFAPRFNHQIVEKLVDRLGLISRGLETDGDLFVAVFNFLAASKTPFEQFFHDWYGGLKHDERSHSGLPLRAERSPENGRYRGEYLQAMLETLGLYQRAPEADQRLKGQSYFQNARPCSLLIDEIEAIWDAIAQNDDWSKFESKISEIRGMGRVYGRRSV